jgi:hypothetical protein
MRAAHLVVVRPWPHRFKPTHFSTNLVASDFFARTRHTLHYLPSSHEDEDNYIPIYREPCTMHLVASVVHCDHQVSKEEDVGENEHVSA